MTSTPIHALLLEELLEGGDPMANEHTKYILKCDRKIGVSPSGEPIWQKNVFEEFLE